MKTIKQPAVIRTRRWALAAAMVLISSSWLAGRTPVEPINKDSKGVAVKGYDVVAYQTQSRPVKGSPRFVYQWGGATWWFADENNRNEFAADPQKYAPQFGGYCSWAVSKGYTADVDPDAWRVIEGRLYLNYDKSVQRKWEQDVAARIADANRNWPTLHK